MIEDRAHGTGNEQVDRLDLGERGHRVLAFGGKVQRLTARDDEIQRESGRRELGDRYRRHRKELLEVVQHDQRVRARHSLRDRANERSLDRFPDPQDARKLGEHEVGIGEWREADEPRTARVVGHELGSRLDRQPRLADPTRAGERQQPDVVAPDELDDLGELSGSAEERRRLSRQVPRRRLAPALEHVHQRIHVLAPAPILELDGVAARERGDRGW